MLKVSYARKAHGNAVFIAGFDAFLVADAAAGLNDGFYARFSRFLHAVGEGEERVGRHDRALRSADAVLDSLASRPDAVGLSHANAQSVFAARKHYGVGFTMLDDCHGKLHGLSLIHI